MNWHRRQLTVKVVICTITDRFPGKAQLRGACPPRDCAWVVGGWGGWTLASALSPPLNDHSLVPSHCINPKPALPKKQQVPHPCGEVNLGRVPACCFLDNWLSEISLEGGLSSTALVATALMTNSSCHLLLTGWRAVCFFPSFSQPATHDSGLVQLDAEFAHLSDFF